MIDDGEKLFSWRELLNFDEFNLGGSWSIVSRSECASVIHISEGGREKKGADKGDLSNPSAYRLVALQCPLLAEDATAKATCCPRLPKLP